jgi:hypothetical protein
MSRRVVDRLSTCLRCQKLSCSPQAFRTRQVAGWETCESSHEPSRSQRRRKQASAPRRPWLSLHSWMRRSHLSRLVFVSRTTAHAFAASSVVDSSWLPIALAVFYIAPSCGRHQFICVPRFSRSPSPHMSCLLRPAAMWMCHSLLP